MEREKAEPRKTFLVQVPIPMFKLFKAKCKKDGISMNQAIVKMMKIYIKENSYAEKV